jgi:hypothetical protein
MPMNLYQFGSIPRKFKQKPLTAVATRATLAATRTHLAPTANSMRELPLKHPISVERFLSLWEPIRSTTKIQLRSLRWAAPEGYFAPDEKTSRDHAQS